MAFRPDYSPILAAGAAQGQGLAALGSGISSYLGQKREDQKIAEQKSLTEQKTAGLKSLYDQALGGNVEAQNQLAFEAPKINAQVMEMLGAKEESQQKGMIADAAKVISLHQAGDKDQAINFFNKRIEAIQARGGDPSDTIEIRDAYEKNPEIGIRVLKSGLQAMLSPEDYVGSIQDEKPVKIKPMTEYQKVQTDLRKAETEERKLDRQIKRETNEIKRDELKSQISQAKEKSEQLKKTDSARIDNAVVEAKAKKTTINELLANQNYIESLTGYTGRIPVKLTDAGVEAQAIFDNIKNSMTIENLSVMSGPLTDRDIQIIDSASSRLKAGMGEAALRKELDRINGAYDRIIKNYDKEANRKGYKKQNEEAVKNESTALSDEDLLKKYGG